MSADCLPAVLYTDLDGTLLDHHRYEWGAAASALAALGERGVPVVPITSKTLAEMLPLRVELGLETAPFAVENGGAICAPAGYFGDDRGEPLAEGMFVEQLGPGYDAILAQLAHLRRSGFAFTGFADMDAAAVSECTGLMPDEAAAARDRLCSEPLLWHGDEPGLAMFRNSLAALGLTMRRGGRFLHVMGAFDKGKALQRLHARFRERLGARPEVVAIGDSDNDLDMLAAADRGYLVARPDGSYAAPEHPPRVIHADGAGPTGWARAVTSWLGEETGG